MKVVTCALVFADRTGVRGTMTGRYRSARWHASARQRCAPCCRGDSGVGPLLLLTCGERQRRWTVAAVADGEDPADVVYFPVCAATAARPICQVLAHPAARLRWSGRAGTGIAGSKINLRQAVLSYSPLLSKYVLSSLAACSAR